MELDGEVYPVRLVVASKLAPKDPTINNINFFTQQEFITPTSQNFSIINNHNSKAIKHSNSKLIQAVVNKHVEYPTQEHPQFQYGEFIIRALHPQYGSEGDSLDNTNDKK